MKYTRFTFTSSFHEELKQEQYYYLFPNQYLYKKTKYILVFCLAMVFSCSIFAVDLQVTGITGTYAAANGIYYLHSGTKNGYSYWEQSGGTYNIHYALYTDGTNTWPYWYIDNDYDDNLALFYGDPVSTPSLVPSWTVDQAAGTVSVLEYSTFPEINITGNGTSISSGASTPSLLDYTKFGAADITGATITRTFTIQNSGAQALSVGAITISGTNASDFGITTSPASSVAASGSTTFVITFNPSAVGDRTASVSIVNSDPDENPYTFAINGYGYIPSDLVVTGITSPADANGTYIHQGVLNDFQYWKHSTLDYIIYHKSSGTVQQWIIDITPEVAGDGMLFLANSAAPTPAGITAWDASSYVISSVYYTSDGNPTISQTTAVPEINVKVGQFTIADGNTAIHLSDNTNFGTLNISSGSRTRTFTIENNGTAVLTLSGTTPYVTITGTNAADFSVTTAPASSVAASGTTTFVVTFDPSTVGTKAATLNIINNDDDEGSYHFNIQGDAITPKSLVVSNITTPSAANGTYTYLGISNEFQYWRHSSGSYYIYNYRASSLSDATWYIDADMDAAAYNYKSVSGGDNAAPLGASWSAASGSAGTPIIIYGEAEINITGNSVSIVDGDATPSIYDYSDFGWITSGSVIRTYTIQNLGTETLTLTGTSPYVVIGGTNSADFSVTTPPTATIAAGGTTTFQVTATPSALGVRSATLSIANNDTDENPYNFSIQVGLGITPVVTTQAVSSIGITSATGNGNVTTLGSPNPTAHGICWNTTGTPTTADSKTDNGAKSSTGAFTASITGLTEGSTYYVRAFATNSIGTSYGAIVSFTTQSTPSITWNNPSDIVYGTLLSATQLNATASVPGTFTYTPALGTKLNAGSTQSLKVDFTPTNEVLYLGSSKTVTINVTKATPVITWSNPADINNETALSNTQLNASADVSGTFTYNPAIGAILSVGNAQVLKADFAPSDPINYESASKTVLINILLTTGTTEVETSKLIVLYPNPVEDAFKVIGIDGQVTISLTNLNGKVVLTKVISADEKVSVTNLSSGIYLVKIIISNGTILKKMIKE
jgi:hypothetical protein